uniref:40S ribosomal protein S21 n=2 Tax=Zea mays TaxID=4577 RepID=A0A804RAU9_MAIZE
MARRRPGATVATFAVARRTAGERGQREIGRGRGNWGASRVADVGAELTVAESTAELRRRRGNGSGGDVALAGSSPPTVTMQNEEGKTVDLYVPRKCSATNRIITAKDHASVQINIGHLDANGLYDGHFTMFALSGFVRAQGDADSSLDKQAVAEEED